MTSKHTYRTGATDIARIRELARAAQTAVDRFFNEHDVGIGYLRDKLDQLKYALGSDADLPATVIALCDAAERCAKAEKDSAALHHAYLRLRALVPGAFETPYAPSAETVWSVTESAMQALLTSLTTAEADLASARAQRDRLAEGLKLFEQRVRENGEWDDGCFYYGGTSASELQEPLERARSLLSEHEEARKGEEVTP